MEHIGRTGRIGHRGVATSFFTDRDDAIASVLTRTLLETKQEIPEFLQMFVPEGPLADKPKFETESDFDPNDLGVPSDIGGGSWGQGDTAGNNSGAGGAADDAGDSGNGGGGWGGGPDNSHAGGWGTSAPAATSGGGGW